MPPQVAALVGKITSYFRGMIDDIMIIYGEKGFAPFKKPAMIALPVLLVLYAGLYSPASKRLSSAKGNVASMTTIAQHAEEYETSKTRIAAFQRRLPRIKDKDEWLNFVISNSARKIGVSVDSQSAQRETEVGNYLLVSREVSATTTYPIFGRWLAEIENSQIFVRVTDMSIHRDENNPGAVKVTLVLSTIFPKLGGG